MKKDLLKLAEQESVEGKDLSDYQMKKIIIDFEKKLVIPKYKGSIQILLCPVGLVGSGKSTIIKSISKKLNLLRISTDEIREMLKKRNFNVVRTVEIATFLINKYLDKKYSVALDADCISPMVQNYVKKVKKERNIIPIWIHIKTSEKEILSRMKKGNLSRFFNSSTQAMSDYKRRKPLHKKYLSGINFYFKFNSVNDDIKIQIKEFVNKVNLDFKNN